MERFIRSTKEEALGRMILFGEASLRSTIREYLEHYHRERNHQGLENKLIESHEVVSDSTGEFQRRERLGGLLNYYHRAA